MWPSHAALSLFAPHLAADASIVAPPSNQSTITVHSAMADNAKRTRSPSIASTSPGSPSVSLTPSSVSSASSLQSSIKHESSDQEDDVLLVDTSPKKEVFSISRSRNFFADGPDQDKPYFISDIAEGQSDIPVRVLNTVDDTDYGSDVFIFTRDNIYQIPESKNVV
uniref:Secreted protein n=1 Tax=Steinernema glaseri TaxID=37863 RepID=A0A1I8ATH1_9BILA